MKKIVNKLILIERETSEIKGEYDLFAFFLRDDSFRWDILVAAKWISSDKENALGYISEKVQNALATDEIIQISRIVILDDPNLELPDFLQDLHIKHGAAEVKDEEFLGQHIKRGYIITANSNQAA